MWGSLHSLAWMHHTHTTYMCLSTVLCFFVEFNYRNNINYIPCFDKNKVISFALRVRNVYKSSVIEFPIERGIKVLNQNNNIWLINAIRRWTKAKGPRSSVCHWLWAPSRPHCSQLFSNRSDLDIYRTIYANVSCTRTAWCPSSLVTVESRFVPALMIELTPEILVK